MYITYKKNNYIDNLFDNPDATLDTTTRIRTTYIADSKLNEVTVLNYSNIMSKLIAIKHICNNYKDKDLNIYYDIFKIPKRTHGFREISAPKAELKEDLKRINYILVNHLNLLAHDSAWAYIKHRDVVQAMQTHTNNNSRWYLKIDLKNFFGSCNKDFILKQLIELYPFKLLIEQEKTYNSTTTLDILNDLIHTACLNNVLPQGSPLSPLLSNLVMIEFDYKINKLLYNLSKENKLFKQKYIYTRYADDIIISARNKFEYSNIINALNELFKDTPLNINTEKIRFGSTAGRNWNLGVMCNKDNKITVGHKRKQLIKSTIHNYIVDKQNNIKWPKVDLQYLLGQLSWLRNVEREYYTGLMSYFKNKYNKDIWHNIITDIKES